MAGQNVGEIRFGPSRIFVGSVGNEVELGHTEDGVLFTIENREELVFVDEFADMPVDAINLGNPTTVEMILKQFAVDQLLRAIHGSVAEVGGSTTAVHYGAQPGDSKEAVSVRLRIHELAVAVNADETRDFVVHKAIISGVFSPRWSGREAALSSLVWTGLADPTKVAPELFMGKIFDAT